MTPNDQIIRQSKVREMTGLSRSSIYRLEKSDTDFPKRRQISPGSVGWLLSEVLAWIESRPLSAISGGQPHD